MSRLTFYYMQTLIIISVLANLKVALRISDVTNLTNKKARSSLYKRMSTDTLYATFFKLYDDLPFVFQIYIYTPSYRGC